MKQKSLWIIWLIVFSLIAGITLRESIRGSVFAIVQLAIAVLGIVYGIFQLKKSGEVRH